METNNRQKKRRLTELFLLGFSLICFGIILVEIIRNLIAVGI